MRQNGFGVARPVVLERTGRLMTNLNDEQRRALELLGRSPNGCTEALMLAHGFTIATLAELSAIGLLRVDAHNAHAGGRQKMVAWMQISAAGRKGIA
jgi:hypothetical protein